MIVFGVFAGLCVGGIVFAVQLHGQSEFAAICWIACAFFNRLLYESANRDRERLKEKVR